MSFDYTSVDRDRVATVDITERSQSSNNESSLTPAQQRRKEAIEAHPEAFEEFKNVFHSLLSAQETGVREVVWEKLNIDNPFDETNHPQSVDLTDVRDELPINGSDKELPKSLNYLLRGLTWQPPFEKATARRYAKQYAWFTTLPVQEQEIEEYYDERAEAYLRDLDSWRATSDIGTQGDEFETDVQRLMEKLGFQLGPRWFSITYSKGNGPDKQMDINTTANEAPVIIECFHGTGGWEKKRQVRDYGWLYERATGEIPHLLKLTTTPGPTDEVQSQVAPEVEKAFESHSTMSPDIDYYDLYRTNGEYGSIESYVRGETVSVVTPAVLVKICGYDIPDRPTPF